MRRVTTMLTPRHIQKRSSNVLDQPKAKGEHDHATSTSNAETLRSLLRTLDTGRSRYEDPLPATTTTTTTASPKFTTSSERVTFLTLAIRVAFVCAFVGLCVFKDAADATLAEGWSYLANQWWFRHESCEPMVATIAFIPAIYLWYFVDTLSPADTRMFKRFRVRPDVRHADDMSAWTPLTLQGYFSYEFIEKSRFPILLAYILPLIVFDRFHPRRIIPEEPPSTLRFIGEIVLLLIVYDALFFFVHRTLHKFPTLYRNIHKKHHTNTEVTRANDAVRLTFTEEFLDVSCSIVGVNVVKAHPMSRIVYNIIIVCLLVELHCGWDFPWMLHNVVPFKLMGGPPRHDAHHNHGRNYFQKFFTYLDDYFGPLQPSKRRPQTLRRRKH